MSDEIKVGTNRTGVGLARERTEAMLDGTEELIDGSADLLARGALREEYLQGAGSIGTMPSPVSLKGLAKTATLSSAGLQPMLFMDKLGERLLFERGGTRLYEALLHKLDALGTFPGGPAREDLQTLLDEEAEHHHLLQSAIESLGGDPTVVTPSADIAGVAAGGIFAVIVDPRTTLLQSLEAIAIAERTDNDGWETLLELAELSGEEALAESFAQALADEADHLVRVQSWIAAGQGRSVERILQAAVPRLPPMPEAPVERVSKTLRIARSRPAAVQSTRKKSAHKKSATKARRTRTGTKVAGKRTVPRKN